MMISMRDVKRTHPQGNRITDYTILKGCVFGKVRFQTAGIQLWCESDDLHHLKPSGRGSRGRQ